MHAPLDVLVICKVGHPLQRELAVGAVSAGGELVTNENALTVPDSELTQLVEEAQARARELDARLRGDRPRLDVRGRSVAIVDDGIATSATMMCAIAQARRDGAARVICAAPVAPRDSVGPLAKHCERAVVLVCADDPRFAVGRYYADFHQVTDAEVNEALEEAASM